MNPKEVLDFWFKECEPKQRFIKDKKFDIRIRRRFLKTYEAVVRGETARWRTTARGRLAEVIVLDQFARNMFRATPQAFAHDALALTLAQEALRADVERKLNKQERMFLYIPFTHSESRMIHKKALSLFKKLGDKKALWYERDHKKTIDRFGRYPHRNKILGRKSTPTEIVFLKKHKGY